MMKATLQGAVLLGLLAVSVPSFAEVQNVKISGEVTVRGFYRKNLRLAEDVFNGVGGNSTTVVDTSPSSATSDFGPAGDSFFQQLTALNVTADLTENVSSELRLINQKVWTGFGLNANNAAVSDAANAVDISLANVTLKELFYAPLTVKIGRQRLWFGRGFIVGSRLLNGDTDPGQNLAADEYTDQTGFDAIRGTLDLSSMTGSIPVIVDGVYAKVNDRVISGNNDTTSSADDLNLTGVNIGAKFSRWNSEAEAYYWNKHDAGNNTANSGNLRKDSDANTMGLRGSFAPLEGASVWSELAYQWGHRITSSITFDAEGAAGDPYQAWAMDLGADYTAKGVAWTPTIGGEWIFYSGAEAGGIAIGGWDAVYRGRYTSLIREFQGAGFYMPAQSGATVNGTYNNVTNSTTNEHQFALHATVKPLEDLSVDNRVTWFTTDTGIRATRTGKRKSYLGTEWDVNTMYNYTDDVQLGLIYGVFWPGNVFRTPYDDVAQELVSSVSVKF